LAAAKEGNVTGKSLGLYRIIFCSLAEQKTLQQLNDNGGRAKTVIL